MATSQLRRPTCPSLRCASLHRLRLTELFRDVPISASVGVSLPERPVLLDFQPFGCLKLRRRHVVSRNLNPNRHFPKFGVGSMIWNALGGDIRQAETVGLVRLRVDMSVDSWLLRKRNAGLPLAGSAHRQHALCQLPVTYAAFGSRRRWGGAPRLTTCCC